MNTALAEVLRYNKWATLRLLEALRGLSEGQLAAQPSGVSGSVGSLLTHLIGGQQTFVLRIQGRQHEGELSRGSAWPGFDALLEAARASSDDLIAIAEGLDEGANVVLGYMGKRYSYPRSFFLVHATEHGVEHRTEIKVALNQMGIETPDLDGWSYAQFAGFGKEVAR
jgi:uncharacterized damage-inducible protein DinB